MDIVLLRHGIAVDRAAPGAPPDPERPLTARGERRTAAAAAGLAALELRPDVIVTSPWVRARRTAEIARDVLGPAGSAPLLREDLLPDSDPSAVLAGLRSLSAASIVCVGHAPGLDLVVARALECPRPVTALKKAGAARLSRTDDGFRLAWVLEPRALRRLGRRG